jgi:nucleoside-diphosphate-sugar epimerase
MNVLITGHSGFLGDHTAKYFISKGHKVYGLSRSIRQNCEYQQYACDILDKNKVSQIVSEKFIGQIIHIAGKPIVADCDKDPFNAFMINGLGTASILEAAKFAGCEKTIVVETDKVYGFQEEVPTKEDAELKPNSPYELSKALSAQFCDFYRKHYSMDIVSVRPVNLFGEGDYSYSRVIPASMRNVNQGVGIPVHEDGDKIFRDFLYVKDAAEMLYILSTNKTKHKVYNFSSNSAISITQLAKDITRILNHNVSPVTIKKPGNYREIPYQSIDGSRFIEEFDYKFTPFEVAIKETHEAYKKAFE